MEPANSNNSAPSLPSLPGLKRGREDEPMDTTPPEAKKARLGPLATVNKLTKNISTESTSTIARLMSNFKQEIEEGTLRNARPAEIKELKSKLQSAFYSLRDREDVPLDEKNGLLGTIQNLIAYCKRPKIPRVLCDVDPVAAILVDHVLRGNIRLKNNCLEFSGSVADLNDAELERILPCLPFKDGLALVTSFDFAMYPNLGPGAIAIVLAHCPRLEPASFRVLVEYPDRFCDRILRKEGKDIPVNSGFLEHKCPRMFEYPLPDVKILEYPLWNMQEGTFRVLLQTLCGMYDVAEETDFVNLTKLAHVAGWVGADTVVAKCDEVLTERVQKARTQEPPFLLKLVSKQRQELLDFDALPKLRAALKESVLVHFGEFVDRRIFDAGLFKEPLSAEEVAQLLSIINQAIQEFTSNGITLLLEFDSLESLNLRSYVISAALMHLDSDAGVTGEFRKLVSTLRGYDASKTLRCPFDWIHMRFNPTGIKMSSSQLSELPREELAGIVTAMNQTWDSLERLGVTVTNVQMLPIYFQCCARKYVPSDEPITREIVKLAERAVRDNPTDFWSPKMLTDINFSLKSVKLYNFLEAELAKPTDSTVTTKKMKIFQTLHLAYILLTGEAGATKDVERACALLREVKSDDAFQDFRWITPYVAIVLHKAGKSEDALQMLDDDIDADKLAKCFIRKARGERSTLPDLPRYWKRHFYAQTKDVLSHLMMQVIHETEPIDISSGDMNFYRMLLHPARYAGPDHTRMPFFALAIREVLEHYTPTVKAALLDAYPHLLI